ncbi:hypothetical protein [Herpetosiphon llansteffanensis]|uniref:hypothetical protein n=1 Tax=Herpetosiphon llansteffanensis TaxID=2094568 RepID=UPI000D7BBC99|nr:hypothetical protein [Herpetosiphon llansteffanensis]
MSNNALFGQFQQQLAQQWLIPRAIDAAADALRHWYATNTQTLPLNMLALYPHSLALDLADAKQSYVVTRIDVGIPMTKGGRAADSIDVGTFWFVTNLDGSVNNETLMINPTQTVVNYKLTGHNDVDYRATATIPTYLVNDHGSSLARASWHEPTITSQIDQSLVTNIRAVIIPKQRIDRALAEGYALLTSLCHKQPASNQLWNPASITLQFRQIQLIYALEQQPLMVEVMLELRGMGQTTTERLGSYHCWTLLDGTIDDSYLNWNHPSKTPAMNSQLAAVPMDILRDLGVLNSKRQATLGRLIDVVGIDGLQRLMAEARTRVAELALSKPDPSTPKSVRSMLWQMLEHDALDPHTRTLVLGLTQPKIPADSHYFFPYIDVDC